MKSNKQAGYCFLPVSDRFGFDLLQLIKRTLNCSKSAAAADTSVAIISDIFNWHGRFTGKSYNARDLQNGDELSCFAAVCVPPHQHSSSKKLKSAPCLVLYYFAHYMIHLKTADQSSGLADIFSSSDILFCREKFQRYAADF